MVNFMDGICPVFSGSCGFLATIDTERGFFLASNHGEIQNHQQCGTGLVWKWQNLTT